MSPPIRLGTAAMVLALAAACHAPPATLARTHPAPPTVRSIATPRWVDQAAGVVEVRVECRSTTVEVWCRDQRRPTCESRRVVSDPTGCPGAIADLDTAWGPVPRATVTSAGVATFTIHPQADLAVAEVPLSPPATPPQRSYRGTMIGVDLALLVSSPLAVVAAGDRGALVGGLYVVAYLASGPIIHLSNGGSAAARSLFRRALTPLPGLAAGGLLAFAMIQGCDEDIGCTAGPGLALLAGGVIGVLAAVIPDWGDAHVDAAPARIAPVISSDGERTMFGLGGRF